MWETECEIVKDYCRIAPLKISEKNDTKTNINDLLQRRFYVTQANVYFYSDEYINFVEVTDQETI